MESNKKETTKKKDKVVEEKITEKKEEKVVEKTKDTNKTKILIISAVVVAVAIGLIVGVLVFGGKGSSVIKLKNGSKLVIKDSETKKIEYEKYDNGLVSLDIPKGWKVEVAPSDYIHYNFYVYDPNNRDYMFFFGLKFEGYTKSEKARNWHNKYYPSTMLAKLPAIDPQTTEQFYKVWNTAVDYSNKEEMKYSYFTHINDFEVIENLGSNVLGGDILRAKYTNDKGELQQGLFTAAVTDVGSYYANENPMNLFSKKIDVWTLFIYNIMYMSTPDGVFNDWQPILDKCLGSIQFSDTFVSNFNKEETTLTNTILANQKVYNEISDMIMDSWEKRNASYDIISQKQSDATLGYERVYDTETGEVYKAYNGFTDDYSGERYKPITDDMYTSSISGYIEK